MGGIRDSVAALDFGLLCSVDSDTVFAPDQFFYTKWVCWATKVDDSVAQWTPDRPHSGQVKWPASRVVARLFQSLAKPYLSLDARHKTDVLVLCEDSIRSVQESSSKAAEAGGLIPAVAATSMG